MVRLIPPGREEHGDNRNKNNQTIIKKVRKN